MDINKHKRSSLKQKNLFPENMSYEEYISSQKQKKIHWDSKFAQEDNNSENKVDFKKHFQQVDYYFTLG